MNLEGCYCECVVKRRGTMGGAFCKAGLLALTTLLAVIGLAVTWLLLLAFAAGYLTYWLWPRFQVTYEYVFCDGQLDFDKILGGEGRKHVYRIDLEHVEMIAPENSHSLDGYRHRNLPSRDFTSLMQEEGHKVFVIIHKMDKGQEEIRFEPDEKMLALMKSKAPRKIVEF